MNKTKIEWVKNPDGTQGYTWNPITGCLNGCPYCYARKLANGRLRERYLANDNISKVNLTRDGELVKAELDRALADPFYPRFWEGRLYHDWGGTPKGIFVCDMGELFGDWLPNEWQEKVFNLIRLHTENRYYLLTKQPQNLIKFSPFPDSCWVGVTATDFKMFGEALFYLGDVEARVKYISFEPLLGRIGTDVKGGYGSEFLAADIKQFLNWLIIGAQTKPYKPPKVEWVEEIVRAVDQAGIPVFLKDNLRPLFTDWTLPEWARFGRERNPEHPLQLRQEMPA